MKGRELVWGEPPELELGGRHELADHSDHELYAGLLIERLPVLVGGEHLGPRSGRAAGARGWGCSRGPRARRPSVA